MPTTCTRCGRVLVAQTIAGTWTCGACVEKPRTEGNDSMTNDDTAGAARARLADAYREGVPLDQVAPVPAAVREPEPVVHPAVIASPPTPATRPEPTWRELGHWLGMAEADDGTPAAQQAGAALRLYMLTQMELPLWAAPELTMIRGKLSMSAALLRYLANRAGYRIDRVDASDESCTAVLIVDRTGEERGRATFTIEDAKRGGLIRNGSPWQTYPARMLWARASAYVVRDFAGEVAIGLQLDDEARESPPPPTVRGYDYTGQGDDVHDLEDRAAAEDIPF